MGIRSAFYRCQCLIAVAALALQLVAGGTGRFVPRQLQRITAPTAHPEFARLADSIIYRYAILATASGIVAINLYKISTGRQALGRKCIIAVADINILISQLSVFSIALVFVQIYTPISISTCLGMCKSNRHAGRGIQSEFIPIAVIQIAVIIRQANAVSCFSHRQWIRRSILVIEFRFPIGYIRTFRRYAILPTPSRSTIATTFKSTNFNKICPGRQSQ